MDLRGLVLIGFSAACLAVSSLAYQESKRKGLQRGLAAAIAASRGNCMENGFDTTAGEVIRAYWGLLPARAESSVRLTNRPLITRHGPQGGLLDRCPGVRTVSGTVSGTHAGTVVAEARASVGRPPHAPGQ